MTDFPMNAAWVKDLVPDLASRVEQFTVDTDELDDELIEVFSDEIVRLTEELKQGLAEADGERIHMSAHSIKGMGGTMGLPEISVLAQEIELMAKGGRMERCGELSNALISWAQVFRTGD
ncbi:MAG: Hpt domain-containing protein [Kiritimatiellales bacterium]|nr:Hpt domain-containing protein [Kiritimatiellales bacterium]